MKTSRKSTSETHKTKSVYPVIYYLLLEWHVEESNSTKIDVLHSRPVSTYDSNMDGECVLFG